jgi:hypothetical protein
MRVEDNGSYVLIGSKGGAPKNPVLQAMPQATNLCLMITAHDQSLLIR